MALLTLLGSEYLRTKMIKLKYVNRTIINESVNYGEK